MEAEEYHFVVGIVAVLISAVTFGTTFVPVKRHKCGNGIYVQFMMGIGILISGFVIYILKGFPKLYPLAMVGGFLWALGNSVAVPLISILGLAVAMLTWNTVACTTGWAVARFGLFGVTKAPPKNDLLNYSGLLLLLLSGLMFLFVKKKHKQSQSKEVSSPENPSRINQVQANENEIYFDENGNELFASFVPWYRRRIFAVFVAAFCGLLYGNRTTPVTYIQDNIIKKGEESQGLVFAFSHSLGASLTTSTIFVVYVSSRSKPRIDPALTMPSILSGIFWSIGMATFLISNEHLSQTISFPMTTILPSCVATLWSILYFREIQGAKNILITICALVVAFIGSILIILSKMVSF